MYRIVQLMLNYTLVPLKNATFLLMNISDTAFQLKTWQIAADIPCGFFSLSNNFNFKDIHD